LPGVYKVRGGEETIALAVNIPPDESLITPLGIEHLEQRKIRLGEGASPEEAAVIRQQMRDAELERKQKYWRPMIIVTLIALIGETWLAGRRSVVSQQPEGSQ
jgi:hypothetical protein